MRIVEDKPCDSCGTMLHKISFIDLSTDERRFDYLDSPNHEEHTRDRCRWAQAESKLAAERERRQREGDEADDLWQSKLYAALAAQKQAEERERRARKQLAHFAQYIIKHLGTRGYHAALASQPADERGEERSK